MVNVVGLFSRLRMRQPAAGSQSGALTSSGASTCGKCPLSSRGLEPDRRTCSRTNSNTGNSVLRQETRSRSGVRLVHWMTSGGQSTAASASRIRDASQPAQVDERRSASIGRQQQQDPLDSPGPGRSGFRLDSTNVRRSRANSLRTPRQPVDRPSSSTVPRSPAPLNSRRP